ncbi:hypothetical protein [Nostoc sp.]|uniref:hypothetical protein n=1 Tax=Nostoc sp. TaxID=1180 RepID=UPI002FF49CEA
MTDKNDVSIKIAGSLNQSKLRGGEINTVQGKNSTENIASVHIHKDVIASKLEGGKITVSESIEQKELIAQLKEEFKQLLDELAENPRTQKPAVAVEIVHTEIIDDPTLKQRLLSALKAGGVEALKAIFNHPAVSIPVETVKGFLEAG